MFSGKSIGAFHIPPVNKLLFEANNKYLEIIFNPTF